MIRAAASSATLWSFEALRPPRHRIAEALASADPALALAAAQALARRAAEGDDPTALAACVPADRRSLPPAAAEIIATWMVQGLASPVPPTDDEMPASLARRLRCAEILADPSRLPLDEASPLDLAAVAEAPVDRAVASGLWRRAATHARAAMRDRAVEMIRGALGGALVQPAEAQEVLVEIAGRGPDPVAARAISLLAEAWAEGLPCPALGGWMGAAPLEQQEAAAAAARLAVARRALRWVRGFAETGPRSVRRIAVEGLGRLGDADDLARLMAAAKEDPVGIGPEALAALQNAKRRGLSLDEAAARELAELGLGREAWPVDAVAEVVSSRADAIVAAVDRRIAGGASRARGVALLEALGTTRAVARLVEMGAPEEPHPVDVASDAADPVLARAALRALGRLEERRAEEVILARLDDEPEACLFALARVGSARTVRHLRDRLAGPRPPWMSEALRVLLRLDPTPDLLVAAVEEGIVTAEVLSVLPAHAGSAQTEALAGISAAPGHPLRAAAIAALGRTGGPLAIDPLATLLTDADEDTRAEAANALRAIGARLGGLEPALACLEGAPDPGAALLAEAALRRLRDRGLPTAETALLLQALEGCAHPRLVTVVRPYLRRSSAEVRKRAVACLAAAGSACAGWLLPYLDDPEIPVARQALIAVGAAAVPGLGSTVAGWLSHPNMNLKKAAAEALARSGDPAVIPALIARLAHHDQPGLRALVGATLAALAGPFLGVMLVQALAAERDPRRVENLAAAAAGVFSPAALAALIAARPDLPGELLQIAYAQADGAGRLGDLDAELRRRGLGDRIPRSTDVPPQSPLRAGLSRAEAERRARDLTLRLREAPFHEDVQPDLVAAIQAAAADATVVTLAASEQRALGAVLPHLDETTVVQALALLARSASSLDAATLARATSRIDLDRAIDPRLTPLLPALLAQRGPDAARRLAAHPDRAVRAQAAAALAQIGEAPPGGAPFEQRMAMLATWIEEGRDEEVLAALEGPDPLPITTVARAAAERVGAGVAMALLDRWVMRAPAERAEAIPGLAFLGEVAEPALLALVRGDGRGETRADALATLAGRRALDPDLLPGLLEDPHPAVREEAARALIRFGDRPFRDRVRDAWLAGALRSAFTMPLDDEDVAAVTAALGGARDEVDQLRLLGPIAALSPRAAVPLLLELRDSPHPRASVAARDALRTLPAHEVLPAVLGAIGRGDASLLEVIGAASVLPGPLVTLAQGASDPEPWVRFGLRAAGVGSLHAAGLGPRIAGWAAAQPTRAVLSLLARLTDWHAVDRAAVLLHALGSALAGHRREEVLDAVLEALREAPPALTARVLGAIGGPADTAVVRALAEAEAGAPGVVSLFPAPLRAAVEASLFAALDDAEPEAARHLLGYLAGRAEGGWERSRVLALLEDHVRSGPRRVRLHAHRLLRAVAPRERYLAATRALLDDADPTTVRLALRTLAYGGDLGAVEAMTERLGHPQAAVARAAREGLVTLGARALGVLSRARARARPDRRQALDEVMEEIRTRAAP